MRPGKNFNVEVQTINNATGEAVKRMVIDYSNSYHRSWLAKHSWWALTEGLMVTTVKTDDPVTFVDFKELRSHAG